MGQKVSPLGLRIGIVRDWDAKWYAPKDQVANLLHEDLKVRAYLENFYKAAYVSRIEIKRTGKRVIVVIHAAKPGVVIGTVGSKKNEAVKALQKLTVKTVFLTVVEIKVTIIAINKIVTILIKFVFLISILLTFLHVFYYYL